MFILRKLHLIPHFCPAMSQTHFFKELFPLSYLQITHLLTGIWVSTEISKFLVTGFNREFSVLILLICLQHLTHLTTSSPWLLGHNGSLILLLPLGSGVLCRLLPSVLCLLVGAPHEFNLRSLLFSFHFPRTSSFQVSITISRLMMTHWCMAPG